MSVFTLWKVVITEDIPHRQIDIQITHIIEKVFRTVSESKWVNYRIILTFYTKYMYVLLYNLQILEYCVNVTHVTSDTGKVLISL